MSGEGCNWTEYRDRDKNEVQVWGGVGLTTPFPGNGEKETAMSEKPVPAFAGNGLCTGHCAVQFTCIILYHPDRHTVR